MGKKKLSVIVSAIMSFILLMFLLAPNTSLNAKAKDVMTLNASSSIDTEVRAVWFSFRDWQKYLQGKDKDSFTKAFETITDNILGAGCNTLIMHVRSHNDAVYPSKIYPWSTEMLMGTDPGYDPLKIMVDIAHKRGCPYMHGSILTDLETANTAEMQVLPHMIILLRVSMRYLEIRRLMGSTLMTTSR